MRDRNLIPQCHNPRDKRVARKARLAENHRHRCRSKSKIKNITIKYLIYKTEAAMIILTRQIPYYMLRFTSKAQLLQSPAHPPLSDCLSNNMNPLSTEQDQNTPPINPDACTNMPPSIPDTLLSSSSRRPRHASGKAFRLSKLSGDAGTA